MLHTVQSPTLRQPWKPGLCRDVLAVDVGIQGGLVLAWRKMTTKMARDLLEESQNVSSISQICYAEDK